MHIIIDDGILVDSGGQNWTKLTIDVLSAFTMIEWCYANLNMADWRYGNHGHFYFKNADDFTLARLSCA
jgi:hypothetical protein